MSPSDPKEAAPPATRVHPNAWYRAFNPAFSISEQPLHTARPLRLLVIGAGASGLLVAYQAARQLSGVTVAVYEKNTDVGGTWFENRYPGIEIDSPSHSYQWSFRPNPDWSRFMVPGAEVQRYLKDWAAESDLLKHVRLNHRIESAIWKEEEGVWEVKGHTADGQPFEDQGEFLFACSGPLK
jgi:cation diffusion facilitator CzcD-associated flavoprotein CzcO